MPLNPPQVGRLSVCSRNVVMEHQLPDAEITLFVDGTPHSLGPAKAVWEVMDLPSGLTLAQDARVTATQSLNGETSAPGSHVVVQGTGTVSSKPLPHPDSHIYRCAGNVALTGMTPGAVAEILSGGAVLGSSVAPEGACIVELSSPVPATPLQARAITCGLQPVIISLPKADPAPVDEQERLPAPTFGSPLIECVEWLRLDGVVPGATVTLMRGDGSFQSWAFATRTWLVKLSHRLENGEELVLSQAFPGCEIVGHERQGQVGPLSLSAPKLVSPWCSGRVHAANLVPGATVIFIATDGTEIGRSGAAGTSALFTIIQPHAATLHARQELCGVLSSPSNSVSSGIDPSDLTQPTPRIETPVRACQTEIKVTGQVGGGIVEIWSASRSMIGWRHSLGSETIVSVAALQPGEVIEAIAVTCAGQKGTSDQVATQSFEELREPLIQAPLQTGTQIVRVMNAEIGARVELYIDGTFVAGQTATADPSELSAPQPLGTGQRVHARQGLCGQWVTGRFAVVSPPPVVDPQPDPSSPGFSKVVISNCHTEHRDVHVWRLDANGAPPDEVGMLTADYNDWGTCPVGVDTLDVDLQDGHDYLLVAVYPDAIGCDGDNDPMKLACRRGVFPVRGNSSGPETRWKVD
jgi:hypothetical protein